MTGNFLDFELEIDRDGPNFTVRVARRSDRGSVSEEISLGDVMPDIAPPPAIMRGLPAAEQEGEAPSPEALERQIRDFGLTLFRRTFVDSVYARYRQDYDYAVRGREYDGLRIRLILKSPELVNLPWEYIVDRETRLPLAIQWPTPVVRSLDIARETRPLQISLPYSILVVKAALGPKSDFPALDVDREYTNLTTALKSVRGVSFETVESLSDLDALSGSRPSKFPIVHFMGHGAPDALVMRADDGTDRRISVTQFMSALSSCGTQVVVLNACSGAKIDASDEFSGFAQGLVRAGVGAVVAMRCKISDVAAVTFSRKFYERIAAGSAIDTAMTVSRLAILESGNVVEWGTPILYMQSQSGTLAGRRREGVTPRVVNIAIALGMALVAAAALVKFSSYVHADQPPKPVVAAASTAGASATSAQQPQSLAALGVSPAWTRRVRSYVARDEAVALSLYHVGTGPGAYKVIGYGTYVDPSTVGRITAGLRAGGVADPEAVLAGRASITFKQADALLEYYLADYIVAARKRLGTYAFDHLSDARRYVIVDVMYNAGIGSFERAVAPWLDAAFSATSPAVAASNYAKAAAQVERFVSSGKRKTRDAQMMRTGAWVDIPDPDIVPVIRTPQ